MGVLEFRILANKVDDENGIQDARRLIDEATPEFKKQLDELAERARPARHRMTTFEVNGRRRQTATRFATSGSNSGRPSARACTPERNRSSAWRRAWASRQEPNNRQETPSPAIQTRAKRLDGMQPADRRRRPLARSRGDQRVAAKTCRNVSRRRPRENAGRIYKVILDSRTCQAHTEVSRRSRAQEDRVLRAHARIAPMTT